MLKYVQELENQLKKVETTSTPDFIKESIEKSRESLKEILRRYPEVRESCVCAIDMATKTIKYDCTRSEYIQKVREILDVIK